MDGPKSDWWVPILAEFVGVRGAEWKLERVLGSGASATVVALSSPDGQRALKLYRPEFLAGANAAAELHRLGLHSQLIGHDCPSLVQIYEQGQLLDSAFVLMELVPWPSLDTVLGAVPLEAVPTIMRDVAGAAYWLDEVHHLVHRDIKPANILIAPDWSAAKLVDLGVVRAADASELDLTDQGTKRPFIATAQYSSPEYLFRLQEPSPDLWRALTYYQIGAVLHDLLTGMPIFHSEVQTENRYILAMAVYRKTPDFHGRPFPARWGALARMALGKDSKRRLDLLKWDDFRAIEQVNLDRIRTRFGVKRSGTQIEAEGHRQRRINVEIERMANSLRDCLVHRFREEGFPPVQFQFAADGVLLSLRIPGHSEATLSKRIVFSIDDGFVRVSTASAVHPSGACASCDAIKLLWETSQETVERDLRLELAELVEEDLLIELDAAVSELVGGRVLPFLLENNQ